MGCSLLNGSICFGLSAEAIGERAGAGRADAARTAGDEGNLASKLLGYGISPLSANSMAFG